MALKNLQNHYLRIESIDINNSLLEISIWRDESTRRCPDMFDKNLSLSINLNNFPELVKYSTPNPMNSISDNLKILAYSELKKMSEYSEWENC